MLNSRISKTAVQEIAQRAAETGPGLAAAAKAIGIQDHQRMLRDAANRVRDSHRAQMKAAGFDPGNPPEDDMGDIIITGDIQYAPAPTPEPVAPAANTSASTAAPPAGLSPLAKTLISAALLGAGAAGGVAVPWLAGAFSKPAASSTAPAVPSQAAQVVLQPHLVTTVPAAAQPALVAPAPSTPAAVNEYQLKLLPQ
ncbi:MAG: hypothetical protein PHU85_18955 [Phycisphaerae bacterium]|nr:hypothetical protein [Phycisphaerae bacterium]